MNKRDIDAFVHDIQLMIPVSDDNSKRFLKDMCSSISDYVSAHEKCTPAEDYKPRIYPREPAF